LPSRTESPLSLKGTDMSYSRMLLLVAAVLPFAASAQEATPEPSTAVSTLSRADVRAALDDARANGGMKVFRAGYIEPASAARSRDAVMAEVRAARASGELASVNAEVARFDAHAAEAARAWLAMRRGE
jgi:hypothetical protein